MGRSYSPSLFISQCVGRASSASTPPPSPQSDSKVHIRARRGPPNAKGSGEAKDKANKNSPGYWPNGVLDLQNFVP